MFCAILRGEEQASLIYEDDAVVIDAHWEIRDRAELDQTAAAVRAGLATLTRGGSARGAHEP
ncbi:HIT family protein [Parafrankia elaeagni]|uniref:hypothetical protein n=1 Tax=Parafrankia elaeagni TaxID=222534 RepID=UPI000370858C|nr:hypothetical protein [Parafrankia elaeagni]